MLGVGAAPFSGGFGGDGRGVGRSSRGGHRSDRIGPVQVGVGYALLSFGLVWFGEQDRCGAFVLVGGRGYLRHLLTIVAMVTGVDVGVGVGHGCVRQMGLSSLTDVIYLFIYFVCVILGSESGELTGMNASVGV